MRLFKITHKWGRTTMEAWMFAESLEKAIAAVHKETGREDYTVDFA